MSPLAIVLIVLLVLAFAGSAPLGILPYNADWGWAPGSVVGLILLVVIVLALTGRLRI